MTLTAGGGSPSGGPPNTIRAIALVGFYRGAALVQPGEILDLSREDFAMHKTFNQVDHAPAAEPPPADKPAAKKARDQ